MILSHSKKFIFIHIPKTGGISISSAFESYNYHYSLLNRIKSNLGIHPSIYIESFKPERFHVTRHLTSLQVKSQIKKIAGNNNIFNNYFIFSVVRNPYDILISGYEYVTSSINPKHPSHNNKNFIWMRSNFKSFEDYVLRFRLVHFPNFQYTYLLDNNNMLLVDYIAKLENLNNDIEKICKEINVPIPKIPHLNKSLSRPREFYYTDKILEAVNQFYKKDFDLFNYNMED